MGLDIPQSNCYYIEIPPCKNRKGHCPVILHILKSFQYSILTLSDSFIFLNICGEKCQIQVIKPFGQTKHSWCKVTKLSLLKGLGMLKLNQM